ncbi:MAG TPA: glutamate--tRNA ligase [Planctomycetota bacterium]|nr:glutamate--tRNA ligase [Planctomycetota bacterium]
MASQVRVRVAPSPTGDPHVGTAYIALFNRCFARQQGGKFVLRIEDTDRARSTPESEQAIFAALRWLGLDYDEGPDVGGPFGPYRQSERSGIYREHAQLLLNSGAAYRCFCTAERLDALRQEQRARKLDPRYDRLCLSLPEGEAERRAAAGERHVVRLKIPDGQTAYDDRLRGTITFQNSTIDDQVLLKSDGFPTYHLANVVDDHLMRITHVCRAEEWITSTPKHVLLYQAFGWEMPVFIHMPLLRNADRSKISKRKNPTSLDWYRAEGYLPEALLNFLGLMGFSMPDEREVFTMAEMIEAFSWNRVKTGGPVFDLAKLEWLNGVYIRNLSVDALAERLAAVNARAAAADPAYLRAIVPLIQERIKKFTDFDPWTDFFFAEPLAYDPALLVPKKASREDALAVLDAAAAALAEPSDWTPSALEAVGKALCESRNWKLGNAFMTLRVAVTGRTASPPLFDCMAVLGRQRSLDRLRRAADLMRQA